MILSVIIDHNFDENENDDYLLWLASWTSWSNNYTDADKNNDYLLWLASWRREPPKKLHVRKHSFAAHTQAW